MKSKTTPLVMFSGKKTHAEEIARLKHLHSKTPTKKSRKTSTSKLTEKLKNTSSFQKTKVHKTGLDAVLKLDPIPSFHEQE
ncbi:hypothetical protein BB559_006528, partial [Furculomyces boomerangus]